MTARRASPHTSMLRLRAALLRFLEQTEEHDKSVKKVRTAAKKALDRIDEAEAARIGVPVVTLPDD